MSRLLKLGVLAAAGYALWRYLTEAGGEKEQAPEPVRPDKPAPPADIPKSEASSNGGSSSDGGSASPSKAELYERAKELGIEGRSKMTKQQLERAISEKS